MDFKGNGDDSVVEINKEIMHLRRSQAAFERLEKAARDVVGALKDGIAKVLGLSNDALSSARAALAYAGYLTANNAFGVVADSVTVAQVREAQKKEEEAIQKEIDVMVEDRKINRTIEVAELKKMIRALAPMELELYELQEEIRQASGRYLQAIQRGLRLWDDRTAFRQQTAEHVSRYRYKDMAFRIFKNDALQKYRAQFDLASKYVFLAAKAYGYETNLIHFNSLSGEDLLGRLCRERTLGRMTAGLPEVGSGLAGVLAELNGNFQALKGALDFNNPALSTDKFSVRRERFRISPDSSEDPHWAETLANATVADLHNDVPEFNEYCSSFDPYERNSEPAIVLELNTTIQADLNFFGHEGDTQGGESYFPSDHYAIRIRGVGIWLTGYNNSDVGLTTTPRCYLVPAGADVMRVPLSGNDDPLLKTKEWNVIEQVLPLPFQLGESMFAPRLNGWLPANQLSGTLQNPMVRLYPSMRAYHDGQDGVDTFNYQDFNMTSRLVGRSVWNRKWMLIIPGRFLLPGDPDLGINRFIYGTDGKDGPSPGVTDIRLAFQTYQYAGAAGGALQAADAENANAKEEQNNE